MKKYRYGIVGGGATGCTLAFHLTRNGHEVVLFEREKGLGGLAASIPFGKTKLDRFYRHIFTSDLFIQAYIERLGLANKLRWCSSSVGFEHNGKLYPFTTPIDLLRFSPLSLFSRLRVGLAVLAMKRREDYLPLEKISAEDFIIRHMGKDAYQVLWEPLLRSKFGESYRQVSAVWFWGKVKLRGGTRSKSGAGECLGYLKDGWGQVFDRLGEEIVKQGGTFRFGEIVKEIKPANQRLSIHTRSGMEEFDRVIVTPSLPSFAEMMPGLPAEYKESLYSIPYQANITMVLGLEKSISPYYWLNITDPESPFVAVIQHANLFNDPDYGELTPVYLSRYLSQDHPYYSMRMPEVKDIFLAYLEKIFPQFNRSMVKSFTFSKADYAQPVIALNYSEKTDSIYDTCRKSLFMLNGSNISGRPRDEL